MEIELDGKTLVLEGYFPLGEMMDMFLKNLFTRFVRTLNTPYPVFRRENYQDLVNNIHSYLDSRSANLEDQDHLYNNLGVISNFYLRSWRVIEAQQFWSDILEITIQWEQSRNMRVHKGSIFYFWSDIALKQGQLDRGFFLIHSAYEEDVKTQKTEQPDTPAYRTASLNLFDKANLLYGLVEAWAGYLDSFIEKYRNISGNRLTLVDTQTKFLNNPPSRDTLFSFAYTLARFHEFDNIPTVAIQGNFASIYELNTLFDLVLVIDRKIYSSIPHPGRHDWKFLKLANHLLVESGISIDAALNEKHLEFINGQQKNDPERTLRELLDNRFVYNFVEVLPSRLECDIAIAYCLRNYSAHNINSFPIIRERFIEIRQSLFNVLFLAVEFL